MRRILIIEDDPELVVVLRMAFEAAGYEVHDATNGRRGLSKLVESQPDLVLLDLMLPCVSGLDILRRVSADPAFAGTRVIVMTAYEDPDGALRRVSLACGAFDFVDKPFRLHEIVRLADRAFTAIGVGADAASTLFSYRKI